MGKAESTRMFAEFLRGEGYIPQIDEDGDVRFKIEGRIDYAFFDEKDEHFFRLVFPSFWAIESEDERRKVQKAALEATAEIKVAKVFPVRDNVWATIELFCSTPDEAKKVFQRSMSALKAAVQEFADKMRAS